MIYIPVLTLLMIFLIYSKKNLYKINIISYLIIVYLIMGFSALTMHYLGWFPPIFNYSFEAMSYLSIALIIVFSGFTNFNNDKFITIKINNTSFLKTFEYVLIIGGIGAIIFFSPFAFQALQGDVRLNRVRTSEFQQTVLASYGIMNTIFSLLANFFIFMQLLAFINISRGKRCYKKAYLLLFSSFSYVIYVLAYVGRDGIVYWIMSFYFTYLLMKDFLSINMISKIRKTTLLILPLLLVPFFIISSARFGKSEIGMWGQILNYSGQQIKNFNEAYHVNAPITYGQGAFPLFTEWFSQIGFFPAGEQEIEAYQFSFWRADIPTWVFKTYIGSYLADFGRIGTLIILALLAFISRNIIKKVNRTNVFNLSNITLFILLYQIVLWGVFYNKLYALNLYMLSVLLLHIALRIKSNIANKCIYLKKNTYLKNQNKEEVIG